MHHFVYKEGELFCEDVPVKAIVRKAGTPVYIYSYQTLVRHFTVFDKAFQAMPHLICYSCKANANIALLSIIRKLGGGADIVSGGELLRARYAGIPGKKIVFSGVGKTEEEIDSAIESNILMLNVESAGELEAVRHVARRMKKKVPLSIRVNPEIDPKTHPYITTGLKRNKFGILWNEAFTLYKTIAQDPYLIPVGISSHIGSQILELDPFVASVRFLKDMVLKLKREGIHLRYIDIGGGLGITYRDELPPSPGEYARAIARILKPTGLTLILEPGRVLVGNSGILVTKLLYVKRTPEKTFYIVDGAMNDLVRPALYGAYHEIIPVVQSTQHTQIPVDVVGPVCESGDFFAKDRPLPLLSPGHMLAILGAGAYGFSMSSNYNSRRRVAEVLVKDSDMYIIRRRERLKDLLKGESIPSCLEVS